VLAVLAVTALAVGVWRWGWRERRWDTYAPRIVADLPWGDAPADAGLSPADQGTPRYGPLAFAIGDDRIVVADTYHRRLLVRRLRGGPWKAMDLPGSQLTAACALPGRQGILVADEAHLVLWRLVGRGPVAVASLRPTPGATTALWRLACGADGGAYGELVTIGRGLFRVELVAFRARQLTVLAAGLGTDARPVDGGPPLRSFAVGPDGAWYLAGPGPAPGTLTVAVERPWGRRGALWTVTGLPAVRGVEVLGWARGRLYVGVNLGRPGQPGTIVALGNQGSVAARIAVPPPAVLAASYAVVAPNGTVYVADSTTTAFRILEIRSIHHTALEWRL
jgi:hypothetical protein